MQQTKTVRNRSFFNELGLGVTVDRLYQEIRELYLADSIPWVLGYSGGKDSTATLQLIWLALLELRAEQLTKPIHVISTDTLVENPIVAAWVTHSLISMEHASKKAGLPFSPKRLTPEVTDTFWVNLIGKGYPAPRHKFRWCTERLKIKPSNSFINSVVRESGEVILILGTRKAESSQRASVMERLERRRTREGLSPNASLPNSLVYTPIEEWTNDDVWLFLMQYPNPWGYNNKELLTMYQGASPDGECPLVVDTSTPSCGDSRFGCWVCTLVEQDKSMAAMIQNDEEKEWMTPLLQLRNRLDEPDDRHLRDFRRMNGLVQIFHDRPIPGPYRQSVREQWLREVLQAQTWIRSHGPQSVRDIELITMDELREIRRIWVVDKHEFEDSLPGVYKESTGQDFPDSKLDEHSALSPEDLKLLKSLCQESELHYELVRELLDVERRYRTMARRAGLFTRMEKALRRGFYDSPEDAAQFALKKNRGYVTESPDGEATMLLTDPIGSNSPERLALEDQ
jgi:DNA sulfur modification protein DndC